MCADSTYVRVIALDFSKAFDTVTHSTLLNKMSYMAIPDNVYNWIINFFDNCSHCTKFLGEFFKFLHILAIVIQGSVVGPACYVVHAGDMRPVTDGNEMVKYADDTYLIIPEVNSASCEGELRHIDQLAFHNNLRLNHKKSVEIVFHARGRHRCAAEQPASLSNIKRVSSIKILCITINNQLSMCGHITALLGSCARMLYGLHVLRAHRLCQDCLKQVFLSTVLAKLLYASPAWSGFCSAADINKLNNFLNMFKNYYCKQIDSDITKLFKFADESLFSSVQSNTLHLLYPLFLAKSSQPYNLRPRSHNFVLSALTSTSDKCNFITRMLFHNAY